MEIIDKPLLSVIIPCYNVEKYLDRCLESVINQSYRNIEIILVDDGSPDNSGKICDEWKVKDKRIKVIHKQNGGLGYARNSGLRIAEGEFVAFVDSDDYINSNMYETLIGKAIETEADIVYCGHIKQYHNGEEKVINDFPKERFFCKADLPILSQGFFKPTQIAPKMLTMSVWHAVYKRSVISHSFYSEREVGSEDIHFQVKSMLNANKVLFIPYAMYIYCYNGESLSHTLQLDKFTRYKKLSEYLNEEYMPYGFKRPADYCVFIMAFAIIRKLVLSQLTCSEKMDGISKIIKDDFWKSDQILESDLNTSKLIFYHCVKIGNISLMYYLSKIYCTLNYTFKKKRLE